MIMELSAETVRKERRRQSTITSVLPDEFLRGLNLQHRLYTEYTHTIHRIHTHTYILRRINPRGVCVCVFWKRGVCIFVPIIKKKSLHIHVHINTSVKISIYL
jgi:hypothetical protein